MAKMQLNREMENALRKLDMSEEKIAELKERGVLGQSGVLMCDSTIKDIVSNISYTRQ